MDTLQSIAAWVGSQPALAWLGALVVLALVFAPLVLSLAGLTGQQIVDVITISLQTFSQLIQNFRSQNSDRK